MPDPTDHAIYRYTVYLYIRIPVYLHILVYPDSGCAASPDAAFFCLLVAPAFLRHVTEITKMSNFCAYNGRKNAEIPCGFMTVNTGISRVYTGHTLNT